MENITNVSIAAKVHEQLQQKQQHQQQPEIPRERYLVAYLLLIGIVGTMVFLFIRRGAIRRLGREYSGVSNL